MTEPLELTWSSDFEDDAGVSAEYELSVEGDQFCFSVDPDPGGDTEIVVLASTIDELRELQETVSQAIAAYETHQRGEKVITDDEEEEEASENETPE